jgi:hypothetical protein
MLASMAHREIGSVVGKGCFFANTTSFAKSSAAFYSIFQTVKIDG